MSTPIKLMIADSSGMEKVVVELSSPYDAGKGGNFEWGIVSQESSPLTLTLYPRPDGKPVTLDLDDVITALQRAKYALVGSSSV